MPCPVGVSVELIHPFAFLDNIGKVIKSYQRHSTPFIDVPATAIAGMLITVLKQKGWAECRDNVKANERLQACNKKVLIYCLNYFYKNEKRIQGITTLPMLNLLAEGNITQQLLGFIQICKGEDTSIEAQHIMEIKTRKIVAVIHTDKQKQETAYLQQAGKELKKLMEILQKRNSSVSKQIFEIINQRLRSITTMTEQAKLNLCTKINDVFGENDITNKINSIVFTTKTEHIDNDLLTFSMSLQEEKNDWESNKAKMMQLLGKKQ
jgi:hypothetical protein